MSEKKKSKKESISLTNRKYKNDSIRNFVAGNRILTECLESIREILYSEHYRGRQCPFNEEIALNLDKVEIRLKKGNVRDKTIDFVVGLEKDWLLLVEAKLGVENVDNIAKTICEKIAYSKALLQGYENFVHADDLTIVLLNDEKFQQQANRLRTQLIAKSINIKPCNVAQFYKDYFDSNA